MSRDKKKLVMGSFAAALLIVPVIAHAAANFPKSTAENKFVPGAEAISTFSDDQTTAGRRTAEAKYNDRGYVIEKDSSSYNNNYEFKVYDLRENENQKLRVQIVPTLINSEGLIYSDSKLNFVSAEVEKINHLNFYSSETNKREDYKLLDFYLIHDWEDYWEYKGNGRFEYKGSFTEKGAEIPLIHSALFNSSHIEFRKVEELELSLNIDVITDVIDKNGAEERGWNTGT